MKHALTFLATLALCVTAATSAEAAFSCGAHLVTYQVLNSAGSTAGGTGVRCVKFTGADSRRMIWYGEGVWGTVRYRHIGSSVMTSLGAARWADISGNGEATAQAGSGLTVSVSSTSGIPARIQIGGSWNEIWQHVPSGKIAAYSHTLPVVNTCGDRLQTSIAYKGGNKVGIRCMLPGEMAWYGEGAHGASRYAHLGGSIVVGTAYKSGAFDLCDPSVGNYCNGAPFGSLTLIRGKDVVYFWEVPQWGEKWVDQK